MISRLRSYARGVFLRARTEHDMDTELRFHVDARTGDLTGSGLSREDAERRARTEFGDMLRWKEQGREARGLRLLDETRADIRYGFRGLRRSPGFAISAVLSLALGIGGNTAIFKLVDVVLLRSLPVSQPEQLVVLATKNTGQEPSYGFSFRTFQSLRVQVHTLSDVAASAPIRLNVEIDRAPQPTASGQLVSGNYYNLLGVPAVIGRTLEPSDDRRPGEGAVAVLGYGYWQRQFGRDPAVIGRVVRLNGTPFTIVGVSAPEFFGTHVGEATDIAMPLSIQPIVACSIMSIGQNPYAI